MLSGLSSGLFKKKSKLRAKFTRAPQMQCKLVKDPTARPDSLSGDRGGQDPFRAREVCLVVQERGLTSRGAVNLQDQMQCFQMGVDEKTSSMLGLRSRSRYNLGRPNRFDYAAFKYLPDRENYRVFIL